ncbi:1-acyl-sn-glycerol-3-phosphate acyltransferase [Microbacterium sp. zg.B48]|uniref:lysophospholipid acyltransferase family protein n=1 Tax=unclassified Microbacterium TaxID=2609290 RepID=UPI00214C79BC|nr:MULTISPECIES: lysophospholipid acyltransferase family protein [unclassified Microbacterium]MCR2763643.1 1-acyl-sn-glycerol-3-phosphate acyltransferase [Microbacterium sp. zg.B48]MCR2809363.1 1-acyl-sn-glycerol-3-phosphate acyltransferase [Microbacterium sp. zg.B185]WIM20502.1 lysophospholipid acyltransferase family protein [Microbacterium sp. zg-B185]
MTPSSPRSRTSTEASRPSVFWPLSAIVVPLVSLLARIEIIDGHKLPRQGPYVLAPSHSTEFDPLIVAVAVWRLGRGPRFMVKESLFKVPVLGWALRATGMVPVARSSSAAAARATIAASEQLVGNGAGVIVYPEGTLTRDPDLWPMRGKTGAARLALADGIPLIPMAHWGAQEILPRYGKLSLWPLRRRVRVIIGDPVDLSDLAAAPAQPAVLTAATDRLMNAIAALQSQLRGEPAPAKRWNPAEHGQRETGRLES